LEEGNHGLFEGIILAFIWRDWGKPWTSSVKTAGTHPRIKPGTTQM